jgi:hypothetical protein
VKVTLLFFDGCPNWQITDSHLATLANKFGFELERRQVETAEDAQRLQFRGSPSVLINGRDVFASGDEPIGLSCRIYRTNHGLVGAPTLEQLHDALVTANP